MLPQQNLENSYSVIYLVDAVLVFTFPLHCSECHPMPAKPFNWFAPYMLAVVPFEFLGVLRLGSVSFECDSISLWAFFWAQDIQGLLVFLCNPGCSGTHSVDQAGLELTELHLPLSPPKCWD